jgi:tetratricopeptide (TPR) repeat protein
MVSIESGTPGTRQILPIPDVIRLINEKISNGEYSAAVSISGQLAAGTSLEPYTQCLAGRCQFLAENYAESERYADQALAIDPEFLFGVLLKVRTRHAQGDPDSALQLLEVAIDRHVDDRKIQSVLRNDKATILMDMGELDRAYKQFERSIESNRSNVNSLYRLSRFRNKRLSDELVEWAESLIASGQLNHSDQVTAHFALANEYARKNDIARQFLHLDAGNGVQNELIRYDPTEFDLAIRQSIEFFSKTFFESASLPAATEDPVIFIVGMPRCGSTLIEQIISSHDAVTSAGEVSFLNQSIAQFQAKYQPAETYPFWVGSKHDLIGEIAKSYHRKVASVRKTPIVTDKYLSNFVFTGLIHLIFPEAKIIDVRRDPIDTCFSCYKQLFRAGAATFTYSLENLAARYRQYERIMLHWDAVLPGRLHTLHYEQLILDPEPTIRKLLNYCELDWDEKCLRFEDNRQTVRTLSSTQVREGIYQDSIGAWKASRDYLGPLLDLLEPRSNQDAPS